MLCDVNVLVYSFRADAGGHREYRRWLSERLSGDASFGVAEPVLSGFVRVVTHP
jgi:predicted nucleic acid-binding protein